MQCFNCTIQSMIKFAGQLSSNHSTNKTAVHPFDHLQKKHKLKARLCTNLLQDHTLYGVLNSGTSSVSHPFIIIMDFTEYERETHALSLSDLSFHHFNPCLLTTDPSLRQHALSLSITLTGGPVETAQLGPGAQLLFGVAGEGLTKLAEENWSGGFQPLDFFGDCF